MFFNMFLKLHLNPSTVLNLTPKVLLTSAKDFKLVREECVRQRNEVAIILDIIVSFFFLLSSFLLNLQERVIVGLRKCARAPN